VIRSAATSLVLIATLAPQSAIGQSSIGAQGDGILTRESPAVSNKALTEGYLTQPMAMGSLSTANGHLAFEGMLDLEGLTLKRGELDAGISGEGYVDRRHPHTYVHELVATATGAFASTRYSLALGKGFVPFGTDDPMTRPFAAYPVNHHLAQILERYVAIAAASVGPLTLEGAVFNGDEPLSPGAPPDASRFADSWAVRATATPHSLLEVEGSFASVTSPELASDQAKVKDAFDKIAAKIEAHMKRFYLLSYCTPARKGEHEVTIEAKTNFFRPVTKGMVHGTATPLHVGRTTIVVQSDLRDDAGKRVALVTQTQAVLQRTA